MAAPQQHVAPSAHQSHVLPEVLHLDVPAQRRGCLVADSPHSGTQYPVDFNYACDLSELKKAEDTGIDQLFGFFPALGVPFLQADFPRAYVDPNRKDAVTEKFRAEGEQEYVPTETGLIRARCTPRSSQNVYDRKIPLSEAFNRVAKYHAPYHRALAQLLDDVQQAEGCVVHVNCHSMPSTTQRGAQQNPFDIVIGTQRGLTCAPEIAENLKALFTARGYKATIDMPGYRGAEIILQHGKPAAGRHSLQLEINRGLYMDEDTLQIKPAAAKLRQDLEAVMRDFADYCDALPKSPKPSSGIRPSV